MPTSPTDNLTRRNPAPRTTPASKATPGSPARQPRAPAWTCPRCGTRKRLRGDRAR